MSEVLAGLSSLEINVFISVLHVYGRNQHGGASGSGGSGSGIVHNGSSSANVNVTSSSGSVGGGGGGVGVLTSSKRLVMLVETVLTVCDMLVEVFKKEVNCYS